MVFVSYLSLFVAIIRLADSVCIPLAKDNYIKYYKYLKTNVYWQRLPRN